MTHPPEVTARSRRSQPPAPVVAEVLPRLPLLLRAVNALGRSRPLPDADALIQRAVDRIGGGGDVGEGALREPLGRLLADIERSARLTPMGHRLTVRLLSRYIESRLAMRRDALADPAIGRRPIEAPIFIVGLPRTGTTILHHALTIGRETASLEQWMLDYPSPAPHPDAPDDDRRVRATARRARAFYWMLPAFRAIHTMGARLPNECVALKAHAMTTITFPIAYRVPEYGRWLLDADQRDAYRLHRRGLQHFGGAGRRWVLKSPGHLLALDALFESYPDAWIVHTHRDPVTVMASLASLTTTLRSLASDAVDPRAVGPEVAGFWSVALDRAAAFRRARPELADRFIDVRFEALLDDPGAVIDRVRSRVGLPQSPAQQAATRRFLAEHRRGVHGRHSYRAEDFGLVPAAEAQRFAAYRDQQGWT